MIKLIPIILLLLAAPAAEAKRIVSRSDAVAISRRTVTSNSALDAPALSIPVGVDRIGVSIDISNHTNPAVSWSALLELSYDGGMTWPQRCGGRRSGAIELDDFGKPVLNPTSEINCPLREASNRNRKVRGSFSVTGGNLNTEIRVVFEEEE